VVSVVAATVLALSAASSTDAAAARSFSISASASASLDASESRSVAAAAAVVSVEMPQSSADWRAASRGPRGRLARHGTGCRYPSYDKLHLQLGPLHAELAHLAGASLT
jgi:hypothetical protein